MEMPLQRGCDMKARACTCLPQAPEALGQLTLAGDEQLPVLARHDTAGTGALAKQTVHALDVSIRVKRLGNGTCFSVKTREPRSAIA